MLFCPPAHAIKSLKQIDFTLPQIREKIKVIKHKDNIEEPQKLKILYAYYETEDNLEEIETLKKEKLLLKDEAYKMIMDYRKSKA